MIVQFLDACNNIAWPGVLTLVGTLLGNWAGDWIHNWMKGER